MDPTWGGTQANAAAHAARQTRAGMRRRFDLLPSGLLPSAPASHRNLPCPKSGAARGLGASHRRRAPYRRSGITPCPEGL